MHFDTEPVEHKLDKNRVQPIGSDRFLSVKKVLLCVLGGISVATCANT